MKLAIGLLGAGLALIGVAGGIGYLVGTRAGQAPATAPPPTVSQVTPAPPATPPAHPPLGPTLSSTHPATAPGLPGHPAVPATASTGVATLASQPPLSGRAHVDAGVEPNARFTHFRVGQRNVKTLFNDAGITWVGTSGGVIRYDIETDDYRLFDLRSGLLANGIFHIGKLGGRIVVGTYGGGMALLDEARGGWDIYNIPQGLADAFVYDVLQTRDGDVWIATWSGANRVTGGALDERDKWRTYSVENTAGGLPNDWVYALAEGPDGEVWLATEGGLARFAGGHWENWNHERGVGASYAEVRDHVGFSNDPADYSRHHSRQKQEMGLQDVNVAYNPNYIVALQVDADGTVWAGTWGGGLAQFDGKGFRNFTVADGLPGNHVFALHRDREGRLWVGTNNGLALMKSDGFKVFTTDDGLFSNTVFSLHSAADGSAWIGSFGGVARIARLE